MTHYGEQLVREFEAAYEKEIFRRADAPLRAKPSGPSRSRAYRRNGWEARMYQATPCHAGRRAPRYALNEADVQAHPELFRCSSCHMLLDSPVWGEAC